MQRWHPIESGPWLPPPSSSFSLGPSSLPCPCLSANTGIFPKFSKYSHNWFYLQISPLCLRSIEYFERKTKSAVWTVSFSEQHFSATACYLRCCIVYGSRAGVSLTLLACYRTKDHEKGCLHEVLQTTSRSLGFRRSKVTSKTRHGIGPARSCWGRKTDG